MPGIVDEDVIAQSRNVRADHAATAAWSVTSVVTDIALTPCCERFGRQL